MNRNGRYVEAQKNVASVRGRESATLCNRPFELPRRIKGSIQGRGLTPIFMNHIKNKKMWNKEKFSDQGIILIPSVGDIANAILHSNSPLAVGYRKWKAENSNKPSNAYDHGRE